ncbi:MAG: hypothetical protein H8K03_19615 [Nitrospira sp.]
MPKARLTLLGFLVTGLLTPLLHAPEAGAINWKVTNLAGTTVYCSGSGAPTANLPATCNANLDFQSSGGTARIEAIDGGTNDILKLVNTKLVAKTTITDYVLTFEHVFVPGPTSVDYSPIYYNTRMNGRINGASPSNKITLSSALEHPVGTQLFASSAITAQYPTITFDKTVSPTPSTTNVMTGNRKVIVKLKFSIASGQSIEFPATTGYARASAQMNPDDCPDEEDGQMGCPPKDETVSAPSTSLLSELQGLLSQGSRACLGISLLDGGCIGVQIVK